MKAREIKQLVSEGFDIVSKDNGFQINGKMQSRLDVIHTVCTIFTKFSDNADVDFLENEDDTINYSAFDPNDLAIYEIYGRIYRIQLSSNNGISTEIKPIAAKELKGYEKTETYKTLCGKAKQLALLRVAKLDMQRRRSDYDYQTLYIDGEDGEDRHKKVVEQMN